MSIPISIAKPSERIAPHYRQAVSERRPFRKPSPLLDSPLNDHVKKAVNRKIKDLKENEMLEGSYSSLILFSNPEEASLSSISKTSGIPEVVQDFFDKLVDWMQHVDNDGIKKTTLILNRDPSSIFSGTKITLTEYSSAPKIFNLHLSSSPEAVKLFQAHAQALINAIHHKDNDFDIHRIEADLLSSEEILIYRNLAIEQDQEDEQ